MALFGTDDDMLNSLDREVVSTARQRLPGRADTEADRLTLNNEVLAWRVGDGHGSPRCGVGRASDLASHRFSAGDGVRTRRNGDDKAILSVSLLLGSVELMSNDI